MVRNLSLHNQLQFPRAVAKAHPQHDSRFVEIRFQGNFVKKKLMHHSQINLIRQLINDPNGDLAIDLEAEVNKKVIAFDKWLFKLHRMKSNEPDKLQRREHMFESDRYLVFLTASYFKPKFNFPGRNRWSFFIDFCRKPHVPRITSFIRSYYCYARDRNRHISRKVINEAKGKILGFSNQVKVLDRYALEMIYTYTKVSVRLIIECFKQWNDAWILPRQLSCISKN